MSMVGSGVESSTDFPEFNRFIAWTTDQVVTVHDKVDVTYIVIVTMKSFATNVIIIEVPQLYTKIAGRWDEVISLIVIVDAVDWV